MAAAAEQLKQPEIIPPLELYGESMYAMRQAGKVGNVGVRGAGLEHPAVQQLRSEFESSVFEGLTSDTDFGEDLRVTKFDTYPVVDNQVMSRDLETSMVDLTYRGHKAAVIAAAQQDPRMWTEAERTANDYWVAQDADMMVAGQRDYNTQFRISCDPSKAMKRDGQKFWRDVGYIEDTIYIQMYHAGSEFTAGSISFKAKDKEVLRIQLNALGFGIPEDESVDNYINHAYTATMDIDEAKDFALGIRESCDQGLTQAEDRQDTVDLLAKNTSAIEGVFTEMYMPIAESLANNTQTPKVGEVIAAFMSNSDLFNADIRQQLLKMRNTTAFDGDNARLLHKLAIYAAIERLRKPVDALRQDSDDIVNFIDATPGTVQFLTQMTELVATGVAANRSYSSCGSAIKLGADSESGSPQEAYGGRSKVCNKEVKDGDFVKCPHCSKFVLAVVEDKSKKIECGNSDCALAASSIKAQKRLAAPVQSSGIVISFGSKKKVTQGKKDSTQKTLQPA